MPAKRSDEHQKARLVYLTIRRGDRIDLSTYLGICRLCVGVDFSALILCDGQGRVSKVLVNVECLLYLLIKVCNISTLIEANNVRLYQHIIVLNK